LTLPTIDAHLHVFEAVSDRFPRDVFEPLTPAERSAPAEALLEEMEQAGVDHAVVVAVSPHDEYLKYVLSTYPTRFAGVAVADPESSTPLDDLNRRVETIGIQGLRLFSIGDPAAEPEQQTLFPLLVEMAHLGVKLWLYSEVEQVQLLDRMLELLPDLVVVVNHLGFCPSIWNEMRVDEHGRPSFDVSLPPDSLETIVGLARHPNVYVKMSGQYAFTHQPYPYLDLLPVVERVYQAFGAERMMWASDYPWISPEPGYSEMLALVDHHLPGINADERLAIRGGTAARLFRFG
jgi:predicted TIM-barrel fold metal-dependent hydrolase